MLKSVVVPPLDFKYLIKVEQRFRLPLYVRYLFILKNLYSVDLARNAPGGLAEPDSIYFVHDSVTAKEYMEKQVVEKQSPLDLIITHDDIGIKFHFGGDGTRPPPVPDAECCAGT